MVNVDLYSAIIMKVANALNTLASGEKPGFQSLSNAAEQISKCCVLLQPNVMFVLCIQCMCQTLVLSVLECCKCTWLPTSVSLNELKG